MYKQLLKEYVSRLKKEDVIKYINNNDYEVTDKEIDVIYFYIKNYWEDIYNGDEEILKKIKNDVSDKTYLEVVKLLNKFKRFI